MLRARPRPETLSRASPCSSASTAGGFGAQAFSSASAFNANIGAWNTARVTTFYYVCAAPGPAARTMADALGLASMRRGPLCRCGCRYGHAEGRFDTCIRMYIYVCACVTRLCIQYPFICICENRPAICVRAPLCDG